MDQTIYKDYVKDASKVIKQYPMEVHLIKKYHYGTQKAVWFIKGKKKNYALKRYCLNKDQWQNMISAYNYLSKEVNYVAPLISTKRNEPWVIYNDCYYILTNWVKGEKPDYTKLEDLVKLSRGIADLHQAAQNYVTLENTQIAKHLGDWPSLTRRKQGLLLEYKYEAEANKTDVFNKIYLKHYQKYFELFEEVAEIFESKLYQQWVNKIKKNPCLCVNGFSPHNFSLGEKNTFWLLHLDNICLDLPARDLRKLIFKAMFIKNNWCKESLSSILQNYLEIYPLSKDELQVLLAELKAPHLFLNVTTNYFLNQKPQWTKEKFWTLLVDAIKFEKNKIDLLSRFWQIIYRVGRNRGN
ncbi:MAG: CotS family spore coat protein [Peptococcales bacterium]|jgi:CotS family spore coat protein